MNTISELSRTAKGVGVMRIPEGNRVIGVELAEHSEDEAVAAEAMSAEDIAENEAAAAEAAAENAAAEAPESAPDGVEEAFNAVMDNAEKHADEQA